MFSYEMARRLQPGNSLNGGSSSSITVNALHPGVVRTELSRYLIADPESFSGKLLTLLATPFTLSPEQVGSRVVERVAHSKWGLVVPSSGKARSRCALPLTATMLRSRAGDESRLSSSVSCPPGCTLGCSGLQGVVHGVHPVQGPEWM
jgi:hypothetical protein